ncbi:MAG TPA: hypothetical protein VMV10_28355 [Pirellulales bacterium]|nr:hypothetical protein [Pirellulales bacterium]
MLDATSDFNAAIAAAQTAYQGDVAAEDAVFQSTEDADASSFASQAQGVGEGLQADVNSDDQSFQATADSAANTLQTQDAASDQTDTTLNQAADDQEQQTVTQAAQADAAVNAADDAQLADEIGPEQAALNATGDADATTFNNTMAADQAQTSANIAADQNSYDTTLTADDAQTEQNDAALQAAYQTQIDDLATATQGQIAGAAPAVDPSVVNDDPNYLATLSQANDVWNSAQQQAQDDIANGEAAADAAAAPLFQAASNQLGGDLQNAQNAYLASVQNAQDQYAQAIAPFQQQLSTGLAAHQDAYNQQVQDATDTYNTEMQTAAGDEATSMGNADAAYNTSAQPLIDGYNTWSAGRASQYTSDINAREAQLAQDLAGETQTYNTAVTGLAQTEQQGLQAANSQYASDAAGLASTRSSEDAGSQATSGAAIQGADSALASAEQTYNDTVNQIMQQAMDNNLPPDQGALDAAWATLLSAKHGHANTVAAAQEQLLEDEGDHLNEYETNLKAKYVSFVDAVAAAEGGYEQGVAAAAKLRDDNDADHYASRDVDEAEITAGYNDDAATHYEALQLSLAGFQKTRTDAYDDAVKQYGDDGAVAWQKEQKTFEDASQQQGNDDAASYEAYDLATVGPWGAEQNQIAAAEQQRAHDAGVAYANYSAATAAVQVQVMNGYESAYDTAMGDIEAGLEDYADLLAPAWAAAIIAASGNDPDTTIWANDWASADEQQAADNAALLASEAAQQDGDVGQGLSAYLALVSQINAENQNLEDEWGSAVVALVSSNVAAIAGFEGQVLPQVLSTTQDEINAARTEAGKEIDAATLDAKSYDANDDQNAKDHDAHGLTYAQAVLPAALSDFTTVEDEAAGDLGTLADDAAGYVKQLDTAAQDEIDNLVPDGQTMLHGEAGASGDYVIATTADQVAANDAAAAALVQAVSAAADSDFAGEEAGSSYVMTGIYAPDDPGTVQPDKDLPQPQGILASFLSDVGDFARWLASPFYSPLPGNPPNGGSSGNAAPSASGEALAEAAIQALFPNLYAMSLLSDAGYIPDTYMIGVQGDLWFAGGIAPQVNLAVQFTGGSPLDWQFGIVPSINGGIKGPGAEYQAGIVASAVLNCNDLNELKGFSSSWGLEANPAVAGVGVSVSNIGTEVTPNAVAPLPFVPVDNITGARPTVIAVSGSVGPSSEIVGVSAQVGYTWVETITPRELLTTLGSWENIQNAWDDYWGF